MNRKREVMAVVNVFETGKPDGDYCAAEVLSDRAGISYGRSQATDGGGSLDTIVQRYVDRGGLQGAALAPFLDELNANATTTVDPKNLPAWVDDLLNLLRVAGRDPVMRAVQDEVFDERYWIPAANHCRDMGLVQPLSWLAVYDTCIQSGPGGVGRMRRLFVEKPPAQGGSESAWRSAYVAARRAWLASFVGKDAGHSAIVRKTVYRADAIRALISQCPNNDGDLIVPFGVQMPRGAVMVA